MALLALAEPTTLYEYGTEREPDGASLVEPPRSTSLTAALPVTLESIEVMAFLALTKVLDSTRTMAFMRVLTPDVVMVS